MRCVFLFIFFCLVSVSLAASESYRINAPSGLNVRDYPAQQSKVIGLLPNGQKVEVSNIYGDWGQINYKNTMGYVSIKYLVPDVPISTTTNQTSRPHGSSTLPIVIMVLAIIGCYLIGHDYIWWGIGVSIFNLLLVWYQLDATPWPLWFVTEKGVGLGWMLINMFLMFITISMIWIEITVILTMTGLDDVTIWGAKGLFILRLFSPVPFLLTLLIVWAIGLAIYNSIKMSNFRILIGPIVGVVIIALIVNGGGAICEERFHGFDIVILIAGVIPTVLQAFAGDSSSLSSFSSSGGGDIDQYQIYDSEDNKRRTLTQSSKYSKCYFRDEDGNTWEKSDGTFRKIRY